MKGARLLIAGALALAPLSAGVSMAGVVPVTPGAPSVPWCCSVRGQMKEQPRLPQLPGARLATASLAGKRFRPGRVSGPARRKRPRPGCFHCGRVDGPLTRHAVGAGERAFCSEACLAACQDLLTAGFGHLYQEGPPGALVQAAGDYAGAAVEDVYVHRGDGLAVVSLLVDGLHCGNCVWLIERALGRLEGVLEGRVQLSTGRARVVWRDGTTDLAAVIASIARAGYAARPYDPAVAEAPMRDRHRHWLSRLAIAGFGAVATMFMAEPLYYGYETVTGADQALWQVLRYLGMVIATAAGGYTALPFLRGAYASLRRGKLGMDVLITLGAAATFMASVWGFMTHGPVYFDSLLMFLFLIVLGRYAEAAVKGRVFAVTEHLLGAQARPARAWRDGDWALVPPAALAAGELVEVRPGEAVPADGEITRGRTTLDEAMLTGESRPVARGPGEPVTGGTLNLDGTVQVRLTRVGAESTFARLERLVADSDTGAARIQRLADAAGHWGTLVVLAVALAAFVGWSLIDPARALGAAVAVLIITCPCALGLATPVALVLGTARGLSSGLLFKRSEALEDLAAVAHVVLDKTGTLTTGEPEVRDVLGAGDEALALAAALEAGSEHPLGRAVVRHARFRGLAVGSPPEDFVAVPGCGVAGTVAGKPALVGRGGWLIERGHLLPAAWAAVAERWMAEGHTVLWVARGERVIGALALGDRLRDDAAATVSALKAAGLGVTLLTGDNLGAAQACARAVGIASVVAQVLPAQKLDAVRSLQARHGRVMMVGDGLNDAPALAAADVGVALARGADLSVLAADVVVLGAKLSALTEALALSKRTLAVIRGNFVISGVYNAIAIPLALFGLVSPLAAAVLMPLSSLAVLFHALRLRR